MVGEITANENLSVRLYCDGVDTAIRIGVKVRVEGTVCFKPGYVVSCPHSDISESSAYKYLVVSLQGD